MIKLMSLEYIKAVNNKKTRQAKKLGLLPYIAKSNGDIEVRKSPFLANYLPEGYKIVNTFFVDYSGFGQEGEGALTLKQFLLVVKKGYGYAIAEAGQFQVYINEYKKI